MKCSVEREREKKMINNSVNLIAITFMAKPHTLTRKLQRIIIKFQLKMHKNEKLPLRLML